MRSTLHFGKVLAAAVFTLASILPFAATAQANETNLTVELNKLETKNNGCVAYVVLQNETETRYQSVKVDLVLFQTDGIIGGRYAIELAPIKPKKRSVKLFPLPDVSCDQIGSFLINDIVECKSDAGPIDNCLAGLTVKSLTKVELQK